MPENDRRKPKPDFSQVKGSPTTPDETRPLTNPPSSTRGLAALSPNPVKPTSPSGPKPDFSNVQSGESSTAKVLHDAKAERLYTVKAGDSLSKIAKREYGDAQLWTRIFEANKDTIKNPDLIFPGQVLKLPSVQEEGNA